MRKLDNFPVLKRLKMVLLSNNQVSRIDPAIGTQLPRLHTLILTNNKVAHFADLDALTYLPALDILCHTIALPSSGADPPARVRGRPTPCSLTAAAFSSHLSSASSTTRSRLSSTTGCT